MSKPKMENLTPYGIRLGTSNATLRNVHVSNCGVGIESEGANIDAEELHFPRGRDLEEFASELPLIIGEGEVEQSG